MNPKFQRDGHYSRITLGLADYFRHFRRSRPQTQARSRRLGVAPDEFWPSRGLRVCRAPEAIAGKTTPCERGNSCCSPSRTRADDTTGAVDIEDPGIGFSAEKKARFSIRRRNWRTRRTSRRELSDLRGSLDTSCCANAAKVSRTSKISVDRPGRWYILTGLPSS